MLASRVNLTSFCLFSTFETLPSPSKLKCWRISSEASCFLCNKTICTTAHISGARNIALKQGRFTFRHDLFSYIFATINRFTSNIKLVPPKLKDMIKFVRKGARAPCRKSPHIGILHHALDCNLLADQHDQYSFPSHSLYSAAP